MKFAFSTNAFRKYSLIETITALADIGYQGVEIMADTPHAYPPHLSDDDIQEINTHLEYKNISVSNINAFMLHAIGDTWKPSWLERDLKERQKRVEHTRQCITLASKLGATTLSTEPGGPLEGMSPEEGFKIFKEGLLEIEEDARKHDIKILIEPEPELLIETSRQFLDFIPELNLDVFGLNFDIGHFFCVGEDPVDLVTSLAPYTHHFHLEDIALDRVHHHLLPGTGAIDLTGVLQAIGDSGYQGFVTVELYPYEDKPIETARLALDYLNRITA